MTFEDPLARLGFARVPDTRDALQRAAASFSAQEREEQRDHDRKVAEAQERESTMVLAMLSRGISFNTRSQLVTEMTERAGRVEELETELAQAKRARDLTSRRLAEVDEVIGEARGMASRAATDDLLAPAKAAWAVASEVAAERAFDARVAARYRELQMEASAAEERKRERQVARSARRAGSRDRVAVR